MTRTRVPQSAWRPVLCGRTSAAAWWIRGCADNAARVSGPAHVVFCLFHIFSTWRSQPSLHRTAKHALASCHPRLSRAPTGAALDGPRWCEVGSSASAGRAGTSEACALIRAGIGCSKRVTRPGPSRGRRARASAAERRDQMMRPPTTLAPRRPMGRRPGGRARGKAIGRGLATQPPRAGKSLQHKSSSRVEAAPSSGCLGCGRRCLGKSIAVSGIKNETSKTQSWGTPADRPQRLKPKMPAPPPQGRGP